MIQDAKEILLTEDELQKRIGELARQVSVDYRGKSPLLIGVLKGAFIFMADFVRRLDIDVTVDFMVVSSYGNSTQSSGIVKIVKDLDENIAGRDVILVEDIIDSGLTLHYLVNLLKGRRPATLRICALLDKPTRRQVDLKVDYTGFEIPDEFVVGYGLDYNERYRNVPYIFSLKPEVYS